MSKKIEITFDDNSIEIIKRVDENYRTAIINLGLRLIEKTNFYKTISGQDIEGEDLQDLISLNELNESTEKEKVKTPIQVDNTLPENFVKPGIRATEWGDF